MHDIKSFFYFLKYIGIIVDHHFKKMIMENDHFSNKKNWMKLFFHDQN